MPHSPKELKKVSEELDEDDERAELEDTGIREKNTSGSATSCEKRLPDVPRTPATLLHISSDIDSHFDTTENHVRTEDLPTEALSIFTKPSKSIPVHSPPIQPPLDLPPPVRPLSSSNGHNASVPHSRRKVHSPACSILCEEEESIFPTRKWTKPLSDMGDALNWKLGVLRTFNNIQY